MFAGILKRVGDDDPEDSTKQAMEDLQAGTIFEIDAGDELEFTDPPDAQNAEPVVRLIDRVIASGLMLTYEGFSGDYSQVNYTSGRMGRMDQDPVIRFWQNELLIARMLGPLGGWFKEAVYFKTGIDPDRYRLNWTAPRRPVVDPTKDYPALLKKIRSGLASRQSVLRELGEDPARTFSELVQDARTADAEGMVFDSDPRRVSQSGVTQSHAAEPESGSRLEDEEND